MHENQRRKIVSRHGSSATFFFASVFLVVVASVRRQSEIETKNNFRISKHLWFGINHSTCVRVSMECIRFRQFQYFGGSEWETENSRSIALFYR